MDKRTDFHFLKIDGAILADLPTVSGDTQNRDISGRLISNLTRDSSNALEDGRWKGRRNAPSSKWDFDTWIKVTILGIILVLCIGTEIQNNKLKMDTLRLKHDMEKIKVNIENRKLLRSNLSREERHFGKILNSYTSMESDIAEDIMVVAYD
jgi:hypothetical protein